MPTTGIIQVFLDPHPAAAHPKILLAIPLGIEVEFSCVKE